ncbi:MAG: ankyrin repeat domain-containing protein, partial [Elusimicrobiales bacterium]|nr:ankyrin repeat domain-containing protein [Elusimicrobiales bacterium]
MKELTAAALILWAAPAAAARIEDRTLELYEAAKAGDYPAVKEILDESDQNVNVAYDDDDTSPLMLACLAGEEKMARLLIERGAEIAAVDAAGRPVEEYLLPA